MFRQYGRLPQTDRSLAAPIYDIQDLECQSAGVGILNRGEFTVLDHLSKFIWVFIILGIYNFRTYLAGRSALLALSLSIIYHYREFPLRSSSSYFSFSPHFSFMPLPVECSNISCRVFSGGFFEKKGKETVQYHCNRINWNCTKRGPPVFSIRNLWFYGLRCLNFTWVYLRYIIRKPMRLKF